MSYCRLFRGKGRKKTSVEELLEKETGRKTKKVRRQGTREKGVIIAQKWKHIGSERRGYEK